MDTIQERKRISPVISVSEYRELREMPSLAVGHRHGGLTEFGFGRQASDRAVIGL